MILITKKIIFYVLLAVLVIASAVTIYSLNKKSKAQEEQITILEQQIATISAEDLVDVIVAKTAIRPGTRAEVGQVQTKKWDRKYLSANMITDINQVTDKIWKIGVTADGPITADMLVSEPYGPTDRLQLVAVDALAPSLKVGDYIDFRMITPSGINYVVMSKKRVNNLYDAGVELVMSEAELMVYSGLMIDQVMNPGTIIYTSKYLEPTLQKGNYTMYVPPQEILDYMKVNANMLYPYLSSDNVQGLRSYIESTQPWMLYGPSTFQTETQAIIDRQEKVTQVNQAFAAAMNSARSQYEGKQAEMASPDASGGGDYTTPIDTSAGTTDTSGGGGIAEDGSYTDQDGNKRDAEGNIIMSPGDLMTGVSD